MGRQLLRKNALWADWLVAVWLAVALVLTLPAMSWQWLDSADADVIEGAIDGDMVPDAFEDDVLHEDHVCRAPTLRLQAVKLVRVAQLEPNEPHTSRLKRPPIAAV